MKEKIELNFFKEELNRENVHSLCYYIYGRELTSICGCTEGMTLTSRVKPTLNQAKSGK